MGNYFPEVREEWGDKDEPEELKAYLDEKVEQARASPASFRPWKPNCQMTPTAEDISGRGGQGSERWRMLLIGMLHAGGGNSGRSYLQLFLYTTLSSVRGWCMRPSGEIWR